jgi:hypothetical protein
VVVEVLELTPSKLVFLVVLVVVVQVVLIWWYMVEGR